VASTTSSRRATINATPRWFWIAWVLIMPPAPFGESALVRANGGADQPHRF
jgi:hypothetical protein